jgi:glycerol-3-phosphate acyltransferase PlsX
MVTIAVDAMGGDHAPQAEVAGAILAGKEYSLRVLLVGREELIRQELARRPEAAGLPLDVVHAKDHITMEDSAAKAVRTKPDSSLRVASRLVRDGAAQGFVSAGNTGAAMATAKIVQGVVAGVERPALAGVFPTRPGNPVVLIDVGANVDCTPRMLAQFAVMGSIYSRVILHISNPRVGILSIGEEDHKGNELTRNAAALLKTLPLNFCGNVEGRDLYSGATDVIVCDGFIGNVALKVSEGLVDMVGKMVREALSLNAMRKTGYLLARGAFADLRKRVDYSEYGGAPLLGVKGVCIISHGRSNANAIKNAIRVAAEFAGGGVNEKIEDELRAWSAEKLATKAT